MPTCIRGLARAERDLEAPRQLDLGHATASATQQCIIVVPITSGDSVPAGWVVRDGKHGPKLSVLSAWFTYLLLTRPHRPVGLFSGTSLLA